jgi:outer membrane lipoprotein-sorting protein
MPHPEVRMHRKLSLLVVLSAAGSLVCTPRAAAQTGSATPVVAATVNANPAAAASGADTPLPAASEILQKYQAAIGGKDAWSGITTRSMKGIYQTEDLSGFAGIEIITKAPNESIAKISFPRGAVVREVCDGKAAWVEDPRGGVHQFTGAALESRLRQAIFSNTGEALLMTLTGRVLGTTQVGAHSTYVMEFSPAKKITSKVYFDVASGLAVRADDTIHRDEGDYTVQTYMDDYRPVDGAYYPFRIRHVEQGNVFTVRITQVKNNPPVDDSLFLKTDSPTGAQ